MKVERDGVGESVGFGGEIPFVSQTREQFGIDRPVLIGRKDIMARIGVMADQIYADHMSDFPYGPPPTLILLEKGAKPTVKALHKALKMRDLRCDIAKVRAKSRKHGMEQEATLEVTPPIEKLKIRDGSRSIFVDDVLDSGMTLNLLVSQFELEFKLPDTLKPKIAVLLEKEVKKREFEVNPDYIGFRIPYSLHWVEGFGMDTDEKGRRRRNIIVRNDKMRGKLGDAKFDEEVNELLESLQAA